jgi:hypothetical protein
VDHHKKYARGDEAIIELVYLKDFPKQTASADRNNGDFAPFQAQKYILKELDHPLDKPMKEAGDH